MQRRPNDWIKFINPKCRDEQIKPYKSEYVPKTESRLDQVFEVDDLEGNYLVNFEPVGYKDTALPARMMRYRSDIWEATLNDNKGTPHILQAVILFYPKHDNENHVLKDSCDNITTLHYTYRVIRIWEYSRQEVIEKKLLGLYPLLPLMKGKPGEKAKEVIQESIKTICQIEDAALQKDLLAVMALLAGGKYPVSLVKSLIGRELIMQSPIYQDWIREEREEAEANGLNKGRVEGKAEGKAEATVVAICKYLNVKFGQKSQNMQKKVRFISDLEILDQTLEKLFAVDTLEEAKTIIFESIVKSLD